MSGKYGAIAGKGRDQRTEYGYDSHGLPDRGHTEIDRRVLGGKVMKLDEYEDFPEGMSSKEVESLWRTFLHEEGDAFTRDSMEKMYILCDKQWHTYELPSSATRESVKIWIEQWLKDGSYDPELVSLVVYCFGLEKRLLEKILARHKDMDISDYEIDIENSPGEFIDPYWSLR